MKLSFHIQDIPCAEEYYMGAQCSFEDYWVEVPDEYFPKELLEILTHRGEKFYNKQLINIAVHAKES